MNLRIIIIGGMGPQASVNLHQQILECATVNGVRDADEFPEIVHASLPITDFISRPEQAQKALHQISAALERLYHWQDRQSGNCL